MREKNYFTPKPNKSYTIEPGQEIGVGILGFLGLVRYMVIDTNVFGNRAEAQKIQKTRSGPGLRFGHYLTVGPSNITRVYGVWETGEVLEALKRGIPGSCSKKFARLEIKATKSVLETRKPITLRRLPFRLK